MSTTPAKAEASWNLDVGPVTTLPWNVEEAPGSLPARFEQMARAYPEVVAIKNGDQVVRYAELNASANPIAHALLARLGEANIPVASLLSDRVRVIQALVAVLKAGKIHTPLVPEQPAPRLQQILDDAGSPLVLVDAAHRAQAAQLGLPPERLLDLDALDPGLPAHDPSLSIPYDSFAYMIYTSGSTGRPKGVVHKCGLLVRAFAYSTTSVAQPPGLPIPLMASTGYVAGVGSMLYALLSAATLCTYALEEKGLANLREFVLRERVIGLPLTSSTFRHFMATLSADETFPDVKYVTLFGEAVLRRDFELFKQHFPPDAQFMTGLGSTEAGSLSMLVLSHQSVVTERVVPAGYAGSFDGFPKEVYIVDEDGQRVGPGVAGEITVKSAGLAEYWNNAELNARTFLPDPDGTGMRIFRTGDLGLLRADGMLEHRGRKDFQVKVRGNRIELGEIEMALFDLGNIREAVVVARPDAAGETQLVAYVVPERINDAPQLTPAEGLCGMRNDEGGLSPAGGLGGSVAAQAAGQVITAGWLRRRLAESLPAYMVPAAYVVLEALPLTMSGKIDRAQLPVPELARVAGGAARDALEAQLAQMWEALLHVPQVGRDEDFFDLGGNSLLAMRLFAEIQQTLGRKLPLSILFQAGTIAELAELIRAAEGGASGAACLVPIQTRGSRRPFFLAAGGGGGDAELLVYARLARHLGAEQPFYGLRARAVGPQPEANGEVEAIAAGHVGEIRAVQPHGPYLIGGECIGGVVAVEIARQLRVQGEEVSLLCLLDTICPSWRYRIEQRRAWVAYRSRQAIQRTTQTIRRATRAVQNPGRIPEVLARPRPVPPDYSYTKATMRYQPRPSHEHITLLINQEYHRADPTLGWKSLAGGGIEVHALPGTHETYIRQNVQATGECLRECLEKAQGQ